MKYTVPSKTLHTYASAVSKVINAKNAITILNNFLFTIADNTLTITACDGENTLQSRIPILDVEGEGSFCIDARRLVELLRVMPEQELKFNIDDTTLAIVMSHPSGSYKFMVWEERHLERLSGSRLRDSLDYPVNLQKSWMRIMKDWDDRIAKRSVWEILADI